MQEAHKTTNIGQVDERPDSKGFDGMYQGLNSRQGCTLDNNFCIYRPQQVGYISMTLGSKLIQNIITMVTAMVKCGKSIYSGEKMMQVNN